MTVDVAQQGRALLQALALGAVMGMTYDLFRILRVRVRIPLLGPALDLLFWLGATLALFLWSQGAWGGEIRLYGALFCLAGGGLYFWLLSRWLLWAGYRLADLVELVLGILTFPLGAARRILKKIRKNAKSTFLFRRKWYKIRTLTKEMDRPPSVGPPGREERIDMRFKRAGFLTKIIVLALLIYMATSLLEMRGQIQSVQQERDILAQQVADQRLENQELSEAIESSDDPDMLEQVAREKGYVKQNEVLYDDVAN